MGIAVLVLLDCVAAVFASIGTLGVAFAFGLSVVAMPILLVKYHDVISILSLLTLRVFFQKERMLAKDAVMYFSSKVIGAIIGLRILYCLVKDFGSQTILTGANGFAEGAMMKAFVAEFVFTSIFVLVVIVVTSKGALNDFAGLAIGLALVLIHIVCIPITGTSVNPARSIGPAIFQGSAALTQLWVFIVAPLLGATLLAIVWKILDSKEN